MEQSGADDAVGTIPAPRAEQRCWEETNSALALEAADQRDILQHRDLGESSHCLEQTPAHQESLITVGEPEHRLADGLPPLDDLFPPRRQIDREPKHRSLQSLLAFERRGECSATWAGETAVSMKEEQPLALHGFCSRVELERSPPGSAHDADTRGHGSRPRVVARSCIRHDQIQRHHLGELPQVLEQSWEPLRLAEGGDDGADHGSKGWECMSPPTTGDTGRQEILRVRDQEGVFRAQPPGRQWPAEKRPGEDSGERRCQRETSPTTGEPSMSSTRALTLPAHTLSSDSARVRDVLEKAKEQVGFLPNMYANMVNSPGLLETYLFGYNRFRKESGFSPAEQEVVFLTISRENGCHYCVAAHSMIAEKMSGVPRTVIRAIRDGAPIPDSRLAALNDFTRTLLEKRGWVDRTDVGRFVGAGFREDQVLEIVLAMAVKTLSNWSNHMFETQVDDMFAGWAWTPTASEAGAV